MIVFQAATVAPALSHPAAPPSPSGVVLRPQSHDASASVQPAVSSIGPTAQPPAFGNSARPRFPATAAGRVATAAAVELHTASHHQPLNVAVVPPALTLKAAALQSPIAAGGTVDCVAGVAGVSPVLTGLTIGRELRSQAVTLASATGQTFAGILLNLEPAAFVSSSGSAAAISVGGNVVTHSNRHTVTPRGVAATTGGTVPASGMTAAAATQSAVQPAVRIVPAAVAISGDVAGTPISGGTVAMPAASAASARSSDAATSGGVIGRLAGFRLEFSHSPLIEVSPGLTATAARAPAVASGVSGSAGVSQQPAAWIVTATPALASTAAGIVDRLPTFATAAAASGRLDALSVTLTPPAAAVAVSGDLTGLTIGRTLATQSHDAAAVSKPTSVHAPPSIRPPAIAARLYADAATLAGGLTIQPQAAGIATSTPETEPQTGATWLSTAVTHAKAASVATSVGGDVATIAAVSGTSSGSSAVASGVVFGGPATAAVANTGGTVRAGIFTPAAANIGIRSAASNIVASIATNAPAVTADTQHGAAAVSVGGVLPSVALAASFAVYSDRAGVFMVDPDNSIRYTLDSINRGTLREPPPRYVLTNRLPKRA